MANQNKILITQLHRERALVNFIKNMNTTYSYVFPFLFSFYSKKQMDVTKWKKRKALRELA